MECEGLTQSLLTFAFTIYIAIRNFDREKIFVLPSIRWSLACWWNRPWCCLTEFGDDEENNADSFITLSWFTSLFTTLLSLFLHITCSLCCWRIETSDVAAAAAAAASAPELLLLSFRFLPPGGSVAPPTPDPVGFKGMITFLDVVDVVVVWKENQMGLQISPFT